MRSVHQTIRRLRKERKKTLREVAAAICVPLTTYREWEYDRAIRSEHSWRTHDQARKQCFGVPDPPNSRPQTRLHSNSWNQTVRPLVLQSHDGLLNPTAGGLRLRPCNAPE